MILVGVHAVGVARCAVAVRTLYLRRLTALRSTYFIGPSGYQEWHADSQEKANLARMRPCPCPHRGAPSSRVNTAISWYL